MPTKSELVQKYNKEKCVQVDGRILTRRGVFIFEAKISEGRSISKALKDGVKVTSVAEVFKP